MEFAFLDWRVSSHVNFILELALLQSVPSTQETNLFGTSLWPCSPLEVFWVIGLHRKHVTFFCCFNCTVLELVQAESVRERPLNFTRLLEQLDEAVLCVHTITCLLVFSKLLIVENNDFIGSLYYFELCFVSIFYSHPHKKPIALPDAAQKISEWLPIVNLLDHLLLIKIIVFG